MKQLFLFAGIFILLGVLSCDKKDEYNNLSVLPIWLQQKVESYTANTEMCKFTNIMIAEYQGVKYYIIQPSYSSCMYCDVYDEFGNIPDWNRTTLIDFRENLKIIKTQTACK